MSGLARQPATQIGPERIPFSPRDDSLLLEGDPERDGTAALACSIPCSVCGADVHEPCFDEPAQGEPGFHAVRLAEAESMP